MPWHWKYFFPRLALTLICPVCSMKIVIAPDSFKESMTALEVASEIEKAFKAVIPDVEIVKIPVADGGEGTVQSLVDASGGQIVALEVRGPLDEPVKAFYGLIPDRGLAVIEMAAASGLHLLPLDQRNPLITTTFGTGELIKDALDKGVKELIIGLGGSATNDGGMGMARALGAKFLDGDGNELGRGGSELSALARIDTRGLDPRLAEITVNVACDVDSPLCGPNGASVVYGPQKGATPAMVEQLDNALANYARVIENNLGKSVEHIPGSGAAGGMGAGILTFLNAKLKPGVEIVMDAVKIESAIENADLVITGEGRIDRQTLHGKTPVGVATRAKKYSKPVIAIAGSLSDDANIVLDHGIDAIFSCVPRCVSLSEALENGKLNVYNVALNVAKLWAIDKVVSHL